MLGYLAASIAAFLANGDNSNKSIKLAGLVLPALTAKVLPLVGLAVVTVFTLKALFAILLTRKLALHLAKVEARSSLAISRIVFGEGLTSMSKNSREEVMFAIQVGSSSAFNGILNSVATICSEGFLFVILFTSFIALSPLATLGLFAFLVTVAGLIQFFVGSRLQRAAAGLTTANISAMSALEDLYRSFREISVLGRVSFFENKLFASKQLGVTNQAEQTYLLGMPRYIIETALIAGIFAFGFLQSLAGDVASSISVMGVFLTGGFRILAAMLPFQAAVSNIRSVSPQAETALKILNLGISIDEPEPQIAPRHAGPLSVELRKVSYSYPGSSDSAVRNISMSIKSGTQVALIGPSGAGKSTIADLMLGLIVPSDGEVLVGENEPSMISRAGLGLVSYVPQRTGIVSGSILQNVAIGLPSQEIDEEQVHVALKMANLTSLVEALPNGIATDLGKHSDNLSGGQLQRLGLARAFYSNPSLIVMDEATSGLDSKSEAEIGKTLDLLRGRVTVVLIAHRLNTVKNADEVFVIEGGEIATKGKFDEILVKNPTVAEAARLMSLDIVK
jgi:ATP-binding cassette subfamily C protein